MPRSFGLITTLSKKLIPTFGVAALGVILFSHTAWAQAQQQLERIGSGQTPQDRLQPLQTLQDFNEPGKIPSLSDILKNVHGSYSVSFMGPRLTGDSDETYNIYLPDKAPIQLYHALKLGYQVSQNLQIGVEEDIVNNLVDNIQGFAYDNNGNPVVPRTYGKSFDWYDPTIYFNLPNLVQIQGWQIFTSASFSLPLTQASINVKRVTEFIIQQAWMKDNGTSKWSYGFNLYLNPQFYTDPIPDGFTTRKTLDFSFGHVLNYQVSDLFQLSSSTNFDVGHNSPDNQGFFHVNDGLPDYFQLKATVSPNIMPMWMSISGYFQCLIWNPSWDTAIMGASFSIGF